MCGGIARNKMCCSVWAPVVGEAQAMDIGRNEGIGKQRREVIANAFNTKVVKPSGIDSGLEKTGS